jgi:hypothetical protein
MVVDKVSAMCASPGRPSGGGSLEASLKQPNRCPQDPITLWQSDLSASFDRIGDVQSARGNLEAALQAYGDGLAIREKLAAQDPSNSEWQRDLRIEPSGWPLAAERRGPARRHVIKARGGGGACRCKGITGTRPPRAGDGWMIGELETQPSG